MLTKEVLVNVEGLSEAQINKIVEMSKNDENKVVGERIGKVYGDLDTDLITTSGIQKNQGEKTYDFAKRVIAELKEKGDTSKLAKEIEDLKAEKAELLKKGAGDEDLKKQIDTLSKTIKDKEDLAVSWKKKYEDTEKTVKEKEEELKQSKVRALMFGDEKLTFNEDIPEAARKLTVDIIDKTILSYQTDEIEEDGKKVFVFRDKNGSIMTDPENELKPHTPQSLRRAELKKAGLLLEKREQGGGGTGGAGGGQKKHSIDLSNVKNRVDAVDTINDFLLKKGVAKNSDEYMQQFDEISKENKVSELPLR